MADSTTPIPQMSSSQASKEVTFNALLDAASPAALYGRNYLTTTGLTWGYIGGRYNGTSIAGGTVALTASNTNYIVAARSNGAVSTSTATTNWNDTANYMRLYSVITGAATVTSYQDHRDKEPVITAGTTSQYWRGDKSWSDFATSVRASVLTGLSTAAGTVVTATHTVLQAIGFLQKQVSDNSAAVALKADKSSATLLGTVTVRDAADTMDLLKILIGSNIGFDIGKLGAANTPYWDFHSGATATDYDARIIASGGTGVDGGGTLTVTANQQIFAGNVEITNDMIVGSGIGAGDARIEFGANRSAAGNAYLDFHSSVGSDFDLRLIKFSGANGTTKLDAPGSGAVVINSALGSAALAVADIAKVLATGTDVQVLAPIIFAQYTLATLPSAAALPSRFIEVTDATGGTKLCYSDGSAWKITNTTTTVS